MKTLFDPIEVESVKARIAGLTVDSKRQWGKMTVGQMVAHCALGIEMAIGEHNPPRMLIGRILGGIIKPLALKEDTSMRRNTPTAPSLVVKDVRDLVTEKSRLCGLIDRFAEGGPEGCTKHPHTFFGVMSPEEWAGLMHKHVDHHLRQFGA